MTSQFCQLSIQKQIARLRVIATDVSAELELNPIQLKLIHYGYNATFKIIDSSGQAYALKLILDSPRSKENLRAEQSWCIQLNKTGIPAPLPLTDLIPVRNLEGYEKPVYALCFHWMPGRKIHERPAFKTITDIMFLARNIFENPPTFRPNEHLPNFKTTLGDVVCHISNKVILEALAECNEAISFLWKVQSATPLHFDLHNRNVLRHNGTLYPFDFEYSHIAPPLIEVANQIFNFTYSQPKCNVRSAVWNAMDYHWSDFGLSARQFEALILARKIMFNNDLYFSNKPDMNAYIQRNTERTEMLAEHFLRTSQYDPSILP